MKLIDINTEQVYTLQDIYNDWKEGHAVDPYNFENDFTMEMYVILMDTINGRNDCDIVGLTPSEIGRIIRAIRKACERKGSI